MDSVLSKIYYDPIHPASFSSTYLLYKAGKRILPTLKLSQVKDWLSRQETYTLHRQTRQKFPRRKTVVSSINAQWQADLAIFDSLARYNDEYKSILVCIDCFSRYARVCVIKNKGSVEMVKAFKKVFKDQKCKVLQSDDGMEFKNRLVLELLAKNNIRHFTTSSDTKSSLVERLIRTLKSRLYKYFTSRNCLRYVDVLQKIVTAYNNSVHSSLHGLKPSEVTEKNQKELWQKQYGKYVKKMHRSDKFSIGDRVVLTKLKKAFRKGYLPLWTHERFTVVDQIPNNPPVWKLIDDENNLLKGVFYASEMQKVKW